MCFLLAATFWLLNAFNQTYTTRIQYPVRFLYNQRDYVPVSPLPAEVTVSVTGKGWHILRRNLRLGKEQPALIRIPNLPGTTYLTGSILAPAIRREFTRLLVNYVVSDTLYFQFDRKVHRKQQLLLDTARLQLAPGLRLVPPVVVTPAFITYTGPATFLDTLPEKQPLMLPPKTLQAGSISETVTVPHVTHPMVQISATQAVVSFKVAPVATPAADSAASASPLP